MKIKINKSPIFGFVILAIMLDLGFTETLAIPPLTTYANTTLAIVIVAALLFFNSIVNNYVYNTLKPYRNYSNAFLIILALSIVVVTLYSYNKYGQTFFNYFSCFRAYLYFLLAVPIIYVLEKQNGYDYFMKALIVLSVIYIILCFINAFYYQANGHLLFAYLQFGLRNNRLRCHPPSVMLVVFPYIVNKFFEEKLKKDKAKWLALFLLFSFFIYYICMTRMISVAYYAFMAFTLVLVPKNANVRRTLILIYILGFFILVATGQAGHFVEYIQARDNNLTDSAEARQNSVEYFKTYFRNNPYFSMGYVTPTDGYFLNIFSGKGQTYFYDDIGIINIPLHYGIVGTVPFALYVIRIIYLTIKIYFINKSPRKALFMGILIFTSVTQTTLSIFDGQRIMGAVVLWALFEYEAHRTEIPKQKYQPKIRYQNHKILINAKTPAVQGAENENR